MQFVAETATIQSSTLYRRGQKMNNIQYPEEKMNQHHKYLVRKDTCRRNRHSRIYADIDTVDDLRSALLRFPGDEQITCENGGTLNLAVSNDLKLFLKIEGGTK
jgi:hypothetical protein